MIALSSHRPMSECTPEIALNQCRAKDSWDHAFEEIHYFGGYEPELASERTFFHAWEGKPTIASLAAFAARQRGWVALINADIIIGAHWPITERRLSETLAKAAISRRWQFQKGSIENSPVALRGKLPQVQYPQNAKVTDWGLDFFAAHPAVWEVVSERIPEVFTLGRILFDTWLYGFFMAHCQGNVADLTNSRVVFHPFHGDRRDQNIEAPDSPYLRPNGWPQIVI